MTAVTAESDQVVAAGQPVMTVVRSGEIEAEVGIPEGKAGGIAEWSATAMFWSEPGRVVSARLRELSPEADPVGRTYRARFTIGGDVALGATVTITLRREGAQPVAEVPATALIFQDDRPTVWVVAPSGDRVLPVPVTVERLGAETVRLGGLPEGVQVVTLGVHRLDEGLPIRVVETLDLENRS